MPAISVVMPVYNVAPFVGAAIRSVLLQRFTDFELIIVDDGSTDDSPSVCAAFHDPRINIIRQENRGLAGARNAGIRAATGRYVAFLDSDDLWLPDKLARHFEFLNTHPKVGVSFDRSAFIDDDGHPMGIVMSPRLSGIDAGHVLTRNPIGNGSAPVIRRTTLNDIRLAAPVGKDRVMAPCWFDETFRQSEDIECWMRIALRTNWEFAGIDAVLTQYRVSNRGLSANIPKQLESWERMIRKVRTQDQDFADEWERLARAYQLRYLARRAVSLRDGAMALRLLAKALATDISIALREPRRTLATFGAASLLRWLPRSTYEALEQAAMRAAAPLPQSQEG